MPVLPDDWRTVIPARLEALVAAWQQPDSWQGVTTVGGVTMPATDIGYVANNELVLHGWDLSAATDQPFEVAEPNLDASWVMVFNTPDDPAARGACSAHGCPLPRAPRCWTGSWPAPAEIRTGRRSPDSSLCTAIPHRPWALLLTGVSRRRRVRSSRTRR